MSGLLVIASVMIVGAPLRIVGAIIAVPIIASIQIVVEKPTADRREKMATLRAAVPTDPPA